MMYLFWFVEFLFNTITEPFAFAFNLIGIIIDIAESLFTLVQSLPLWLAIPFHCLISISILFRVSQFIPTLGGAS